MFKFFYKSIFISAFFILWFYPAEVQAITVKSELLDSAEIKPYTFSNDVIDNYYSKKQFQYLQEQEKKESFWQWLWKKFWELLGPVLKNNAGSIIVYALLVVILVFFIVILIGGDIQSIFQQNRLVKGDAFFSIENENENMNDKLQTVLKNNDFTGAIRILYLITLQQLDKIHLIALHREKTNRDYLLELTNTRCFEQFFRITRIYDYTWYGKFPVTQTEYGIFEKDFHKMKKLIDAQ